MKSPTRRLLGSLSSMCGSNNSNRVASCTSRLAWRKPASSSPLPSSSSPGTPRGATRPKRSFHTTRRSARIQPADDPAFTSILDNPPQLVKAGQKHGYGLIILALIPITAFCLGTWQVKRLEWKTALLSKLEDRIVRAPLPLPPDIDPEMVRDFEYRRVFAVGKFRHDKEMLLGPRIMHGEDGYFVVTPLEIMKSDKEPAEGTSGQEAEGSRSWWWPWGGNKGEANTNTKKTEQGGIGSTILVNRGWVARKLKDQGTRRKGLEDGEVLVEGLLRENWKRNMFTPDNNPETGEFYFPDVKQMASLVGAKEVWVEQTTAPDMLGFMDKKDQGIPIARASVVDVRNNHAQYIFTWYGLCLATSIMFYMVVKKPSSDITRRVRMNKNW